MFRVAEIEIAQVERKIEIDDWQRIVDQLGPTARVSFDDVVGILAGRQLNDFDRQIEIDLPALGPLSKLNQTRLAGVQNRVETLLGRANAGSIGVQRKVDC